jgi:hypothetical protein
MKAKVIIPVVLAIALLIYFFGNRPSPVESFPSSAPVEIETSGQRGGKKQSIEATVEVSPDPGNTSTLPLRRYNPKKDPLDSQEAKQAYYDRIFDYYASIHGKDWLEGFLKQFSGDEDEVKEAIAHSLRFEMYAAVPYLEEIIQNPDDPNFRLALGALIFFDEDAAYSYAIEQMLEEDALRWTSIFLEAIVNRNKTEYIEDLYKVVEQRGPAYRIIAGALSRMGEDISVSEISTLNLKKNMAWPVLDGLANAREQESVSFLKEHYEKSTDLSSRLYSAYALLELGHSEYREPIVSSVRDLATLPPMNSDAFRDWVKEKGHIADYGINDMLLSMELLEKIEQPDALEILAQVATQTVDRNSPLSEHALALIAKDQSEESLKMLLELTEAGVVPSSPLRAELFALYRTEEAENQMKSVLSPWEIEKYIIVAETKGWRGFFRDPRVN